MGEQQIQPDEVAMINLARRQFTKLLGGGLAALFGGTFLVGWPPGKAKGAVPVPLYKRSLTAGGNKVYAADLVKPEALWAELECLRRKCERLRDLLDDGGSWWLQRGAPVFTPGLLQAYLPNAMLSMTRYEDHHKRRLDNWFELRWATDEESGKPNGNGVSPRILVLVGTVARGIKGG